jgi:hypothetical protein
VGKQLHRLPTINLGLTDNYSKPLNSSGLGGFFMAMILGI